MTKRRGRLPDPDRTKMIGDFMRQRLTGRRGDMKKAVDAAMVEFGFAEEKSVYKVWRAYFKMQVRADREIPTTIVVADFSPQIIWIHSKSPTPP